MAVRVYGRPCTAEEAEGEEGGPPSLAADDPGRAHFARPPACISPSSSRTAPALRLFCVSTGLSTAGGAAAAAEAGGGAPRSPTVLLGEDGRPCSAEEAEEEARRRGWSAREAAVVMECRLIEAGGGGRCSACWLELDAIAARLRRDLGDFVPALTPSTSSYRGRRAAARAGRPRRRRLGGSRSRSATRWSRRSWRSSRRGSGRDCVAGTGGAVLFAVSHSLGGRIG